MEAMTQGSGTAVGLQPDAEHVFAVAEVERVVGEDHGAAFIAGHLLAGAAGPVLIYCSYCPAWASAAPSCCFWIAEVAQFAEEAGGRALRGGCGHC